jgi:hypothetical protein
MEVYNHLSVNCPNMQPIYMYVHASYRLISIMLNIYNVIYIH